MLLEVLLPQAVPTIGIGRQVAGPVGSGNAAGEQDLGRRQALLTGTEAAQQQEQLGLLLVPIRAGLAAEQALRPVGRGIHLSNFGVQRSNVDIASNQLALIVRRFGNSARLQEGRKCRAMTAQLKLEGSCGTCPVGG
jgi:hypothetical protein